ncbi:MAG: hypothetical protein ACFFAS_04140 [Promethearchaeota archaeon]
MTLFKGMGVNFALLGKNKFNLDKAMNDLLNEAYEILLFSTNINITCIIEFIEEFHKR